MWYTDCASSGVCAIVKGVYVIQLREQDFYYNGIDVTIWTAVETATAIIAASIPVLRVFFKEAVSSYSNSRGRSNNHSSKPVPLSNQTRSQRSSQYGTSTMHANGRGKGSEWTTLELMEDDCQDGASQRSILRDEEQGLGGIGRGNAGIVIVEDGDILQTNTFTLTIEDDSISQHNSKLRPGPS